MKDLSIIIVNYNSKNFVLDCVKSIEENYKKQLDKDFEIIVIDNDSKDGSPEVLSKIKNITFIPSKVNLGFSKGNNTALKKASGRYVLFLNPDTIVPKSTLTYMLSYMDKNKEVGASTCQVILPDGKIDDASHRGFPTPWNALCYFSGIEKIFPRSRLFSGYHLGWKDLNKVHEIDALAGAFMLVRREAGDDAKWWDEDYFFYGEDIDFCYMLKQKGWKVMYVPEVSINHVKGASSGIKEDSQKVSTADLETKLRVTKARFNAMRIFYDKHYSQKYPFWLTQSVKMAITFRLWNNLRKIQKSSL